VAGHIGEELDVKLHPLALQQAASQTRREPIGHRDFIDPVTAFLSKNSPLNLTLTCP